MRTFNKRAIELLAPAGNFEIFESVALTNCDAIYFGGQSLNMRLIRKGFNFSDLELNLAVKLAHDYGKKAYITVNNLLGFEEIHLASRYLETLAKIRPDAIIIQDFAVLELVRNLKLDLPIHASVMMNVHNVPMVKALMKHGINRVVLSREATLEDVRWIKAQTGIEVEYFTHGDMCIAHGGQCYYSSMLFGMSSNRGKCLKPCRWWFSKTEKDEEKTYPLAVKDLSLYQYLPEMIHAGVTSFKIEGRMREKEFITRLIGQYGDALDRFIADPIGYDRTKDCDEIYAARKRDLSTGYAFGKPGRRNINTRYEGTGKFYSTGKIFSTPTAEKRIDDTQTRQLQEMLKSAVSEYGHATQTGQAGQIFRSKLADRGEIKLSVRVNSFEQALTAIETGIERLYIAADVFQPDKPMTLNQIIELRRYIDETAKTAKTTNNQASNGTELYIALPRMMNELQLEIYSDWLSKLLPYIDGILAGNLGAIEAFKPLGIKLAGDFGLNIFNGIAAEFYLKEGLSQITPSLEINAEGLGALSQRSFRFSDGTDIESEGPLASVLEVIAHGRLPAMYFDHDFHEALGIIDEKPMKLYNEGGAYEFFKDQHGRTHMMTTHTFTLLPILDQITALGISRLRIEAQTETPESLKEIIGHFKNYISGRSTTEEIKDALDLSQYTYGALPFKTGE